MVKSAFFLVEYFTQGNGIIRNAKRVRSRLSVRIKERKLPIAAPIMPDITANGTIRHSISLFLASISPLFIFSIYICSSFALKGLGKELVPEINEIRKIIDCIIESKMPNIKKPPDCLR